MTIALPDYLLWYRDTDNSAQLLHTQRGSARIGPETAAYRPTGISRISIGKGATREEQAPIHPVRAAQRGFKAASSGLSL